MGDHGSDAGVLAVGMELGDFIFFQRLRRPLARRLGENLNRLAADLLAFEKGIADATGDGHMGAQKRAARFCFRLHNVLDGLNDLSVFIARPGFKPFKSFKRFKTFWIMR